VSTAGFETASYYELIVILNDATSEIYYASDGAEEEPQF
jgi:hypothetical protein